MLVPESKADVNVSQDGSNGSWRIAKVETLLAIDKIHRCCKRILCWILGGKGS